MKFITAANAKYIISENHNMERSWFIRYNLVTDGLTDSGVPEGNKFPFLPFRYKTLYSNNLNLEFFIETKTVLRLNAPSIRTTYYKSRSLIICIYQYIDIYINSGDR